MSLPFTEVKWDETSVMLLVKADVVETDANAAAARGKWMSAITIDGADTARIVEIAKARSEVVNGARSRWLVGLPMELPGYVAAVNEATALTSGAESARVKVELEDPESHEIDEYECVCSMDNMMAAMTSYVEPEDADQDGDEAGSGRAGNNFFDSGAQEQPTPEQLQARRAHHKRMFALNALEGQLAAAVTVAREVHGLSESQIEAAWAAAGGTVYPTAAEKRAVAAALNERIAERTGRRRGGDGNGDGDEDHGGSGGSGGGGQADINGLPPEMAAMMGAMGNMAGGGGGGGGDCKQQ